MLKNPFKAWLSEFLLVRGIFNGPTSQPLYSYQVTGDEYEQLRELLSTTSDKAFDSVHGIKWAALFCLFTAEWFRREYDASEGGWSWNGVENRLNANFNPQQRAKLVTLGLENYWYRSIRYRENGRDLLGSIFSEGGLPWLLVQSDSHGFGRVVRFGLKHFYQTKGARRTTFDLMSECEHYLPQTFRTLETRQLLAGIIEQLMLLATKYPLKDREDPAKYLDEHALEWRKTFPIPLDEVNARGLINDWLKDAGKRRQERKEKIESLHAFTCAHRLLGELPNWKISTELSLPEKEMLDLSASDISSTRLQMAFYEGESLLARGGVIYGHMTDEGVAVHFPKSNITLERRKPDEPLTLRLLANGQPVQAFNFENSVLDFSDSPLIFELRDHEWQFIANASCRLEGDSAYIRMPKSYSLLDGAVGEKKGVEEDGGGYWLRVTEDVRLGNGSDVFSVLLNQSSNDEFIPYLVGTISLFNSLPNTVYMGFPRLEFPEGCERNHNNTKQYVNGQPLSQSRLSGLVGTVHYSLKDEQGETLLRRRFGVLPKGFKTSLFAASTNNQARIVIHNEGPLFLQVLDGSIKSQLLETNNETVIRLDSDSEETPVSLTLAVSSGTDMDPVRLRLPYPYQGVRLLDSNGVALDENNLIVDQLLGMQLLISSDSTRGKSFYICMALVGNSKQRLKREYVVNVGQAPMLLSLFSYQHDMIQMLGAVSAQDAYIRFTVETDQRLFDVSIRRYQGRVQMDGRDRLIVTEERVDDDVLDANVVAMLLSDPKKKPVCLTEVATEGVGTGWHEVPAELDRDGPWIIYPDKDSTVRFRPYIHAPSDVGVVQDDELSHSLHSAARNFHPQYRPDVINNQIEEMSKDFDHSGWQYLADLKNNYAHLPLSTFESWLSVSRNKEALAALVFRLGCDEEFCDRIRDELAVIWDCIPLNVWVEVNSRMHDWWASNHFSEELLISVLDSRKEVLQGVLSGYECIASHLDNGDASACMSVPIGVVLPMWYQELRRTHESNRHWPTDLGGRLADWVGKQNLPKEVVSLSSMNFTNAVTYLPVFMAYVTAGKATLDDLPYNRDFLVFAIKMISDFDKVSWYASVHAAMLSYIVTNNN